MERTRRQRRREQAFVPALVTPKQRVQRVVNRGRVRMSRMGLKQGQAISEVRFGNAHATIVSMSSTFDPFRLNQRYEPEPVGCALSPVGLLEDDDEPRMARSLGLKVFVWVLMGVLSLSSLLAATGAKTAGTMEQSR